MTELTCIICPLGCRIGVKPAAAGMKITGHGCRRGEDYARDEVTNPKRTLTSVVRMGESGQLLPVKTAGQIPKDKIFEAMAELKKIRVEVPVEIGQVIRGNFAGTGVALVATKRVVSN